MMYDVLEHIVMNTTPHCQENGFCTLLYISKLSTKIIFAFVAIQVFRVEVPCADDFKSREGDE